MNRDNFLNGKPLQEVLPILSWFAEKVPGGYFVYSAHEPFEVFYVNKAVLNIYGCATLDEFKELTGYTFRGMVYPEDFDNIQNSIENQIADTKNDQLDHVIYRITRKDGEVRWVDDYGHFATFPGHGDAFYVFISDITDWREMQEENMRMEMQIELDKEKQRNEVKASFLFNISHDILTPLNAIMGFTDLARRHINEPERLKVYLEKVDESNRQMLSLVNDLLDMSKITYGKMKLRTEVCYLDEQIQMVLDFLQDKAQSKKISIETKFDLPAEAVYTDDVSFRKIISSLVDNAIKFTPEGGHVKIAAHKLKVSDTGYLRCEFVISDDGVGMSPEFMSRMYESFEREESSTKTGHLSTGLGLAITKKLLDAMGGSIDAVSEKGAGTVFTIGLPFKIFRGEPEETVELPAATPKEDGNYTHRILLVDDIEMNRLLAETILQESGFSVDTVADGCEAVEVFVRHPPGYYDLILMDIQMPIMNGYEATRAIRALDRPDAKVLPILALSANSRDEDKRMSMESGMNYHIAKPFDVMHLLAAVNKYIAAREAGEEVVSG